MSLALALHGGPYYIGLAVLLVLFFIGLKGINLSLHAIFVKALTSSFREAALAGQFDTALNNMPHGLCMFAADGRLAVMNHRFSEMMNLSDDLVHRGAERARHHRRLRQRRIDLGGERQDDPLGNREFAGEGYHHHRSRRRPGPVAVMDVPADGRRRRRRAAGRHHRAAQRGSQDQPSGALRRTDGASQPGQFPRRDRAPAGGPARCRRNCRHCCLSTSISSSRSTIPWAIPAATSCCARSPTGCARCCARRISWRGSAATNSWCSSRTSNRTRTPPVLPGASSII